MKKASRRVVLLALLLTSFIGSSLLFAQSNELIGRRREALKEMLKLMEQKSQAIEDSVKEAKIARDDSIKKANPSPKAAWEDSVAVSLERIAQGTAVHADSMRAILAGKIQTPVQTKK